MTRDLADRAPRLRRRLRVDRHLQLLLEHEDEMTEVDLGQQPFFEEVVVRGG